MPRVPLLLGDYQARSIIADAQRCVNLYAEANPKDAPAPFTFYNAPGLSALGTSPAKPGRGLWRANTGSLYYVAGSTIYFVRPDWTRVALGTLMSAAGMVSMTDNGTTLVIVDGTPFGYQVDLATNVMSAISSATNAPPAGSGASYAFYGADRVDALDGFMLLNRPGTRDFYATYNNEIVFDATWIAAKNGFSDNLVSVIVTRRNIVLVGEKTTEFWFDAGGAAFPFQIVPGPFSQHGAYAQQSVAQVDGKVFFLSQDLAGKNIVSRVTGYQAEIISTPALQDVFSGYSTTSDAEGFCFQVDSHIYYQINFPAADASWRWDETSNLWHQVAYTDSDGIDHRHRAACAAFAYDTNVVADWETGQLYAISQSNYDDAGQPIQYRRGFPHIVADGKRVIYPSFVLDAQAGTASATDTSTATVYLRWSDDRGRTWSNPIAQSIGAIGQYLTQAQWNRLGMARDRVFEVFGTVPGGKVAINGAWLDPPPIPMAS